MKAEKEILHETRADGSNPVGFYDFPELEICHADPSGLRAVPFNEAKYEKRPKECICHFFLDEEYQERFWNSPEKYLQILQNFRFVCSPDFSVFSDLPKSLAIYNSWRNRTSAFFLQKNGVKIIPTIEAGGEDTWDFCFDGLPKHSTLAITTNGATTKGFQSHAREIFQEVTDRLQPKRLVIIGRQIENLPTGDAELFWFDSFSQQLNKRINPR